MSIRTIIEPFRIKSVEPIRGTTRGGAAEILLEAAGYNLFLIASRSDPDRPADRFGHLGDVHRAVGGDDARRRIVRRFAELHAVSRFGESASSDSAT